MMKVVKKITRNGLFIAKTKQMREMKHGELCYVPAFDEYVLRIGATPRESHFLVLGSSDMETYSGECLFTVRELHPEESITIKFRRTP